MALVDGYVYYARRPLTGLSWVDDFWAVPITTTEKRWRDLVNFGGSDEERSDEIAKSVSPLARPFGVETEHVHFASLVQADRSPSLKISEMVKYAKQRGRWIERGLVATQMTISPFWHLEESSDAWEAGLPVPKETPSFQHLLDLGYDDRSISIAGQGSQLGIETIEMDVQDLEDYRLGLSAAPHRDAICLAIRPDSADPSGFHSPRTLLEGALSRAKLSWLFRLLPDKLRKENNIRPPSKKERDAPGSPWGFEAFETGYHAITKKLMATDPFPLKGGPFEATPSKPLRRTFLLPGVYPDRWSSPREHPLRLGQGWAEAVRLTEDFGLDPEDIPQ